MRSIVLATVTLVAAGACASWAQTLNTPPIRTRAGPSDEQPCFAGGVGAPLSSLFVTRIASGCPGATLEARDWSARRTFGMDAGHESSQPSAMRPATPDRPTRSIRRKVLGAVVGGVGGFFGGMFLGAAIEGDRCDCDDPGLLGAVIGAPIGAAAGGILGYTLLF